MKGTLKALIVATGFVLAGNAAAQITLFQDDGFQGRQFSADGPVDNFADRGFNDKASSAQVRGGTWQVCTDADFGGRCVTLRPGNYPSMGSLGLNDQISSIRPLDQYGRRDDRNSADRYSGERGWDAQRAWDRGYDNGPSDRYSDRYYDRGPDRTWDSYRGQ